ncbi:unnamed protein product [Brassica rapa subsp. trilocularis]
MKLSERGLKLSAKIVYAILTRSIVSVKENEAWFHFGAQPMINTREDASEERVCLAMLILVESILLRKSKGGSFPLEYAKNAQDMTYPWGKEAYIVLLKSIQNAVANHLENKSKFELQGYPLVFLLWILESIPLLRNKFKNPSLDRVLQVEADKKLKVHCILPSIPHDPEDDISIEDKYSDELETVKDVTKKRYKFTADDWENRCVDTFDTLDALIQMMANMETGQASTPIDEDSVNEKVNRIIEVMEENLKSMKDRMSLLEEENMHLRARVSELEGNNNVFPLTIFWKILYIFLNAFLIFDKQRSSGIPLSPMSQQPDTHHFTDNLTHEDYTQPSSETPLSPMSQQPNLTHAETMIESAASPKFQQNEDYTQPSSETPLSPMSQQPNLTHEETMIESDDDTTALDTQVFSPNLTKEKETETSTDERPSNPNQDGKPDDEIVKEKLTSESHAAHSQVLQKETVEMNETPSSPIAPKSIETPVYTPIQTQRIEREPSDDTPALDTQVFTPNLTKERETQTSTDETPPKTNQEEGKTNDEIVIESPAAQTQVLQKETLEMNETPSSPISPKSIEAQVFTPIQKQQTVTEGTYEATQPLTEIISANNKKEDTHAVHHTPSSPLSSLIALVIEENKNALSETETATQYFSLSEGEETQSSRKNQAEENLKDTTKHTTELVSTDVSKTQPLTQPLTQQTQHLQTSEGEQSGESPSKQNQAEEYLKDTREPTTELVSTDDTTEPTTELVSTDVSKIPPITQQTEHLQTSAIDFSETNEVEVSRLLARFQIGAEVEILSSDDEIWYPGKVVDLKLCEGLEELTVEYTTLFADQHRLQKLQNTITADKIRPATPTSDQKSFEMMDKVEVFYNNGWSSGQISMVLGDNTYSVCLYTSMETILFKHSDLRIHREWKDGVWKMADKTDTTPFHETASRQGEANTDQADEQLNNEASIIFKTDTREPMNEITKETPGSPIAQQNIETPVLTPIPTQQETHELMNENISPNIQETHEQNKDVESRVQNTFEIGANVEISSQDDNTCHKWYPGNVLATYLVDGVEMVKVEYSAPSLDEKKRKRSVQTRVSIDRIRPQPPPERPGAKKSYELMDDVEAFDNGAWCAGKVKVILFDGTCFVSLNNSTEQIYFNHSEMRKPRKWVDGVWKMTEKIEEEQTQSVNPSEGDGDKKGKAKAVACKKKKKANAHPVDLLPFLQREEKRPIRPRNPPMPVTPEVIRPIDPFVTPEFPRFSRLAHWMDLRGIYRVPFYINGREIEKEFFQKMDDAENNLNKEHINVAFEMLNCKRVEQGAWFRNNNLPAACFVPVRFLEVVGYAYESVRKPHKKKQTLLEGCVGEVVKGLIHPKKVWLEDVDVIYVVIEDKLSYHYIGVEIQLMDNTITLFHCGLPKANIKRALNQIQELAVLISAIKMELLAEEVNFEDINPFQVKFAEGLPKTKFPYNCGIFVVKMLECRSLGLKSMANINDETAMDLRSKLCCEIFDQFMDKDFQEDQRK